MTLRIHLVFPFVVAGLALASDAPARDGARPQAAASAVARVTAADAARFRAMTSGDLDGLGRLLADNLVYVHSSGRIETKVQFLESLRSGQLKYTSISPSDLVVRANGSLGVVTGRAQVKVVSGGQPREFTIRYTAVYALNSGVWQLSSWQSTRIES